jgi:hypothetical protein
LSDKTASRRRLYQTEPVVLPVFEHPRHAAEYPHFTVKIADSCIVIIKDSEEVDMLKHEQEALRQQLRDII